MTVAELMPPQGGKTENTVSVRACCIQSFVAYNASVDPEVSVNKGVTSRGVIQEHRVDSAVFFALSGVWLKPVPHQSALSLGQPWPPSPQ